jgi:hypothetical protein
MQVERERQIVKTARDYWRARTALYSKPTDANKQRIKKAKRALYQALKDDADA